MPPALAALRGNPGKRALKQVIRVAAFAGPAPDWLSPDAQAFWADHATLYREIGLLTQLSAPAFIMLCDAWGEYVELRRDITEHGRTHDTLNNGTSPRPEVGMLRAAFDRWKVMALEFGVGPSSLTRINVQAGDPAADPVEQFRREKRGAA